MRLCYVANPNTVHVQRWLRHFVQRGHDVHLAIVNPVRVAPERLEGITVHDVGIGRRLFAPAHGVEILRLRLLLRRLVPAVLHAHYVARYGWLAALSGYQPLMLTAWGGDVMADQGAFEGWLARVLTPYALRQAAVITADAPDVLAVCRRYASKSARLETVTFGADLSLFHPGVDASALRQRLTIPDGAPVVLSSRIFAPLYNIDVIIRSIVDVIPRYPDVVYILQNYTSLGKRDYHEQLCALIGQLGVAANVRFVGELQHRNMADLYNLADVVVSVPSADGVPATFFEAMACKAPLVVSDLPAYDGLIVHEQTGLRVGPRNAHAIADAVLRLLDDSPTRQRIRQGAFEIVRERGDFMKEMARVESMYTSVARSRSK